MDPSRIIYQYYETQAMTGHGPPRYYRNNSRFMIGNGFGQLLSSILKMAIPVAKKATKYIARKSLNSLGNVAGEIIAGTSPKIAAKRQAELMFQSVKRDARNKLSNMLNSSGPPRKRPRNNRKKKTTLKKYKNKKQYKKGSDNLGYL